MSAKPMAISGIECIRCPAKKCRQRSIAGATAWLAIRPAGSLGGALRVPQLDQRRQRLGEGALHAHLHVSRKSRARIRGAMPKQSDNLSREGQPSQETEKGLKIPVPKRADLEFFEGVKKKPTKRKPKPSTNK